MLFEERAMRPPPPRSRDEYDRDYAGFSDEPSYGSRFGRDFSHDLDFDHDYSDEEY
jgi:hypothetical protein